ncbi:uncharacterized protein V6R79_009270 [Siganus canaliculatus]
MRENSAAMIHYIPSVIGNAMMYGGDEGNCGCYISVSVWLCGSSRHILTLFGSQIRYDLLFNAFQMEEIVICIRYQRDKTSLCQAAREIKKKTNPSSPLRSLACDGLKCHLSTSRMLSD